MDFAALGLPVLVGLIAVALLFDFLNGLHDAANSIATIVSTRVLKPIYAVFWAAAFNFIAFLFFGLNVAETLGTGIVAAGAIDARVVFGALAGAIVWNVLTWLTGIPSSSSHALIGGLVGAGNRKSRPRCDRLAGPRQNLGRYSYCPLRRLPACACAGGSRCRGFSCVKPLMRSIAHSGVWQFVSASLYSLGHGRQRRAEDHGDHRGTVVFAGLSRDGIHVPFWVVLSCQAAMALGTLAGGWRIVRTMGSRITRLTPVQGFCAEPAAPSRCLWRHISAFRYRRPTPSRERSGRRGRPGARPPCAGTWPTRSSSAWIITIPAARGRSGF